MERGPSTWDVLVPGPCRLLNCRNSFWECGYQLYPTRRVELQILLNGQCECAKQTRFATGQVHPIKVFFIKISVAHLLSADRSHRYINISGSQHYFRYTGKKLLLSHQCSYTVLYYLKNGIRFSWLCTVLHISFVAFG